jgi:hypothetical protein
MSKEAPYDEIAKAQSIMNKHDVFRGTKEDPRYIYTPHGPKKIYEDLNGQIVCEDAE